ncbi:MerR family transcriptional regulator [Candidatus Omnitrophota bacterium]
MGDIYLIKDLSRMSGFSIYTIKYYLKLGLINETGRFPETNYRYFDNKTLGLLQEIHQLRKEKKPLSQIKEIIAGGDS